MGNIKAQTNQFDKTSNKKTIPVIFSSDDNYAPYLAVIILSIAKNASQEYEYEFSVLETSISQSNKDKLQQIIIEYDNLTLQFINVQDIAKDNPFQTSTYFSVETFYRLYIPSLFPQYDKVIYLDVDMIVLDDIAKLFAIDIADAPIGATINLSSFDIFTKEESWRKYFFEELKLEYVEKYFQAGVMIMNLKKMRKDKDQQALIKFALSRKFKLVDQDVLNVYYKNKIYYIDQSWDVEWLMLHFSLEELERNFIGKPNLFEAFLSASKKPKIIHYDGAQKPWKHPEKTLAHHWWQYARQTPFYNEILLKNIPK